MPIVTASAVAPVPGAAQKIYDVIADYTHHHQQILPRAYFRTMVVEAGGVGAGTVIQVEMEVYGNRSSLRMAVSEPEPGRVIQESDLDSSMVTTFTIEPTGTEQATVTIFSQWERPSGLKSWLEHHVRAWITQRIYREELAQLSRYMATI
jgi:hypothetical protein